MAIEPAAGLSCSEIEVSQVIGKPQTSSHLGSCPLNQASFAERPICMTPDHYLMSMSLLCAVESNEVD